MLTVEEMGRTLKYFKWKRSWWESISSGRVRSNNPPPPDVQDGLRAYASRQSDVYDQLITLFVNDWRGFLSTHSLGSSWLHNYPLSAHPVSLAQPHRGNQKPDPAIAAAPKQPTTPSETADFTPGYGMTAQKAPMQLRAPIPTLDDEIKAPLDSVSSEEDGDDDFTPDDLWDDDSADDDSADDD